MTEAILLESHPISGAYPERWFDARGECTFILFEDNNYEKWLGVFGNSQITRYSTVIPFSGTACVLVIARGQGYVVDVNMKELRYKSSCGYIVSAIQVPSRDMIVACDFTDLYTFSSEKELWRSEQIAMDGIEFVKATNSEVQGKAWIADHWQNFTLDVDTMSVVFRKVAE